WIDGVDFSGEAEIRHLLENAAAERRGMIRGTHQRDRTRREQAGEIRARRGSCGTVHGPSQRSRPLAVPIMVITPSWFSHQTSTLTRVRSPSDSRLFTRPRTVSVSPTITGLGKERDTQPRFTQH